MWMLAWMSVIYVCVSVIASWPVFQDIFQLQYQRFIMVHGVRSGLIDGFSSLATDTTLSWNHWLQCHWKMEWVEGDVGTLLLLLQRCFKNDQRRWHSSSCHWTWSQKVFKTWNLSASKHKDINNVIKRFGNYCNLRRSILFECYHFNSQQQKPSESFDCYITTLCQIAGKCTIDTIMPDDNLRDRIIFGITDNKVRERLLHKPKLNLAKIL